MRSSASAVRRTWSTASGCSACCSSTATSWSSEPDGADFVVVNTCGFIERAREESFAAIHEMLELKRQGDIRGVIVSGCLAEREKEALLETLPEIDHLVGVFGREQVTKVADRLIGGLDEQRTVFQPGAVAAAGRSQPAADHAAAFRLSENLRRLRPAVHVLRDSEDARQARHQADRRSGRRGPRAGGRRRARAGDRGPGHDLLRHGPVRPSRGWPNCCAELEQVEGLDWIRLMYLYPMYFGDELIDAIAGSKKIVPYLDLPLQHINDTMLRRMQRRVNRARDRRAAGQAARAHPESGAADHVHHRLSRRDRRAVRRAGRFRRRSSGSSGWACSPIRSSPTRRRPGCPIICREEVKKARRDAADGGAAGDCLRLERSRRSAGSSTC